MTARLLVALLASVLAAGGRGVVSLRASQAPAETGMLVGTVLLSSDRPAAGVEVAVWRGDSRRTVISDHAGEFEFRDLPVGLYHWTATGDGERPQGLVRDRSVIVWPDRIADWRIFLGGSRTGGDGTEAERTARLAALDAAVSRWLANRPDAYEFTPNLSCFCPLPRTPARYHVEGSRATHLGPAAPQRSWLADFNTVEELFDVTALYIDMRPDEFAVAYDETFGHPLQMTSDPERTVADEELRFRVTDFEASSVRAATGAIAGTVHTSRTPRNAVGGVEVIARRGGREHRAVSEDDGSFRLEGLPQGIYTFDVGSEAVVLSDPDLAVAIAFPDQTREIHLYVVDSGHGGTARWRPSTDASRIQVRDRRLARLERQIDRWIETGLESYDLDVESRCMMGCGRFTFRVSDGESQLLGTPSIGADLSHQRFGSVEALFERVLEQVVRTPDAFDVAYGQLSGHPVSMTSDVSVGVSDEEIRFEVVRLSAR